MEQTQRRLRNKEYMMEKAKTTILVRNAMRSSAGFCEGDKIYTNKRKNGRSVKCYCLRERAQEMMAMIQAVAGVEKVTQYNLPSYGGVPGTIRRYVSIVAFIPEAV